MKSFREYLVKILNLFYINEDDEEIWVTTKSGKHFLIDPETGKIKSGKLAGTNIDDYKKNAAKSYKTARRNKTNIMDMPLQIQKQVENNFNEMKNKATEIVKRLKTESKLPDELKKYITDDTTLKKAKENLDNKEVQKIAGMLAEKEKAYAMSHNPDIDKDEQQKYYKRYLDLDSAIWDEENEEAKEKYDDAIDYCKEILYADNLKKEGIVAYTPEEQDIIISKGFSEKRDYKKEELQAIGDYTGITYKLINRYLRKGASALKDKNYNDKDLDSDDYPLKNEENMKKCIAHIDDAISNSTLKQNTSVIRGLNPSDMEKLMNDGEYSSEKFLSTTVQTSTADKFGLGHRPNKRYKPRRHIMIINLPKGFNALPVKNMSANSNENEIMLPRNCKFKLKKKIVGKDFVTHWIVEPE